MFDAWYQSSMSLEDISSLYGLHPTLTQVVQDRVLKLRLVCRTIKVTLESNIFLSINFRISRGGAKGLEANFLQRWHGILHLHCTHAWEPSSIWVKEIRDAVVSGRWRQRSLLSVAVRGNNLLPLARILTEIESGFQNIEINYCGNSTDLRAAVAPLALLGRGFTLKVSIQGRDRGGVETSSWLQHLLQSSIEVKSISLRSSL